MDKKNKKSGMDSLSSRLKICAEIAGSGDELSRKSGIPRRTLESYLSGDAEPKISKIVDIAMAVKVNINWLSTGEGSFEMGAISENDFAVLPLISYVDAKTLTESSSNFAYNKEWLACSGIPIVNMITAIMTDDTMVPTIMTGAVIICNKGETEINKNGIYVININDRAEIRRLQLLSNDMIRVICDNTKYQAYDLKKSHCKVIGRVLAKVEWQSF